MNISNLTYTPLSIKWSVILLITPLFIFCQEYNFKKNSGEYFDDFDVVIYKDGNIELIQSENKKITIKNGLINSADSIFFLSEGIFKRKINKDLFKDKIITINEKVELEQIILTQKKDTLITSGSGKIRGLSFGTNYSGRLVKFDDINETLSKLKEIRIYIINRGYKKEKSQGKKIEVIAYFADDSNEEVIDKVELSITLHLRRNKQWINIPIETLNNTYDKKFLFVGLKYVEKGISIGVHKKNENTTEFWRSKSAFQKRKWYDDIKRQNPNEYRLPALRLVMQ